MEASSSSLSAHDRALEALAVESSIAKAAELQEGKQVRAQLNQWLTLMDDPRARREYSAITGGVDAALAEEDLRHLAA